MRWISDEGVRCGREGAANFAEGVGDDVGSGVLADVVEIARMVVVGWCNGTGRGVVANLRVVNFSLPFLLGKGAGHEERCIGVG